MKRLVLCLALITALLSVAACGQQGAKKEAEKVVYDGPPVEGDWLINSFPVDPETLNFVFGTDVYVSEIGRYVSGGLFDYDKTLEIIPSLAESWEWSPDHLEITINMRKGVNWHDGAPVTMHDVKYTFDKIMDPKSRADNKIASFDKVRKIEVIDDWTLKVYYKEPFSPALSALGMTLIPKHIYEKENWFTSPYNLKPIGMGPYKFVEWKRGSHMILERNPDYWDEKPFLKKIIYKIKPEDTIRFQSLVSGEIDLTPMKPVQWVQEASGADFERRFNKLKYFRMSFSYIGWNMDGSNPFFADKRVRQAMCYAFDREGVSQKLFYGLFRVAAVDIPPESWAHNPNVDPYPYDPEKASALLDSAGWRDTDGDGIRDKNGKPFKFTLIMPAQSDIANQIVSVLKEQLRKIGVEMNIMRYEWSVFLQRVKGNQFEAETAGWTLGIDPDQFDLWHSSQWPDGINYVKYANSEVDKLCEYGRREFDREKRKEAYWRIQEILADEQPYMFLYNSPALVAVDKRFRGAEVSPRGIADFHPGFLKWWSPPGEQRY